MANPIVCIGIGCLIVSGNGAGTYTPNADSCGHTLVLSEGVSRVVVTPGLPVGCAIEVLAPNGAKVQAVQGEILQHMGTIEIGDVQLDLDGRATILVASATAAWISYGKQQR